MIACTAVGFKLGKLIKRLVAGVGPRDTFMRYATAHSWVELNAPDGNYHDRSPLECRHATGGHGDTRREILDVRSCIETSNGGEGLANAYAGPDY
jgi:hypothetical protein